MGSIYLVYIPTAWVGHNNNYGCSYDWNISINWWEERNYTWTSSQMWYRSITVQSSWTYTVKIRPTNPTYWRALAFWIPNYSDLYSRITQIVHDTTYKWYAVSATDTWDYFRAYQYQHLPNITVPAEILPSTVSTVWNYFRAWQYTSASIRTPAIEVLPNSVTSIWTHFRYRQYYSSAVTSSTDEVLSSSITSISDNFRDAQYNHCTSLSSAWYESLPNGITSIGDDFRHGQYSDCSSLTATAVEVLPDWVTSIWTSFRDSQYWQSWVATITWWKDLSIWNTNYRYDMFYGCSVDTITVLSDVWYEMAWRDQTSQTRWWIEHVSAINVPNAYLSNFQDTTKYPWTWVYPKSLFVWY
jgi:hypothetical protein